MFSCQSVGYVYYFGRIIRKFIVLRRHVHELMSLEHRQARFEAGRTVGAAVSDGEEDGEELNEEEVSLAAVHGRRCLAVSHLVACTSHPSSAPFQLAAVEETLSERLLGLTEMFPERAWVGAARWGRFSYWLARRLAWVVGASAALLLLPPFIELQRTEVEEMQAMQKKQVCDCLSVSHASVLMRHNFHLQMIFGQAAPTSPYPPSARPS